jgi:hypothetical protein
MAHGKQSEALEEWQQLHDRFPDQPEVLRLQTDLLGVRR